MIRNVMPIEVEVDGVRLSGFYSVQSAMVTVWHAFLGSRTRTINGEVRGADVQELLIELYQARRPQTHAQAGFWQ